MAPRIKGINELRRELAAKEKELAELLARRKKLAKRLAAVDKTIAALGGEVPAAKPRRGRPPGKGKAVRKKVRGPRRVVKKVKRAHKRATGQPLAEYIKKVLGESPKGMRAKDVVRAVKKNGYKTFSKDFYGIVAAALRDTKGVKRVSRGVYQLGK